VDGRTLQRAARRAVAGGTGHGHGVGGVGPGDEVVVEQAERGTPHDRLGHQERGQQQERNPRGPERAEHGGKKVMPGETVKKVRGEK
jgi:hypothetical protein